VNTTDLSGDRKFVKRLEAHHELSRRSTPPEFIRATDDSGDSPADLAAATNSLSFEGNDRELRRPAPFRKPASFADGSRTPGGRASTR
jgi:hypothetical protein